MRPDGAVRVNPASPDAPGSPAVHVNVSRPEATAPPVVFPVPASGTHAMIAVEEASRPGPAPKLDAEKLVVYAVALELQVLCSTLVPALQRVLKDQLERASLSIVACIAEGAGRRSRKDKRRFYTIARGSAMETAALADVLRLRKLSSEAQCGAARSLALRVVQLLTKLDAALA